MEADDSVFADDQVCSEEDGGSSGNITEISAKTIDKRERRAKDARELVQSQERLLDMLQSMKTDLTKMDREASHIKEDIVRSSQYFNVVVKMKQPHHLKYMPEGYNLPHSIPKVIYNRHRRLDRELNMKYLTQLSTHRPNYPDESYSRRSSVSSQHSSFFDGYYRHRMTNSAPISRRSSYGSGRSSSSANSGFSGTESEIETARTGSGSDNSYSSLEEAGSSTESSQTADYPTRPNAQHIVDRRSSYFYTVRANTPPHVYSDEVEL